MDFVKMIIGEQGSNPVFRKWFGMDRDAMDFKIGHIAIGLF